MNSGELKVDVPLASMESDCEEIVDSVANTPSRKVGNNGGQSGLAPPKILDGGDSLTGSLEDLVNSFDSLVLVRGSIDFALFQFFCNCQF